MKRFFNTAHACNPQKHYMVDPLPRVQGVMEVIEREQYFVIHAPRQTGKTTYLYALEKELNKTDKYIALAFSIETVGYEGIEVREGLRKIVENIYTNSNIRFEKSYTAPVPDAYYKMEDIFLQYISAWANQLYVKGKNLILLIDEADSIRNDDLFIAFLRQLRNGYMRRPEHFPSSIALVGLRDLRDYKIKVRPESETLGTASPFNVKAKSVFMDVFDKKEIFELLGQHEEETGQMFGDDVKEYIYEQTSGQPWLVNALANQIVSEILKNDTSKEITFKEGRQARQELILRRDTHLDCLIDKLKEDRVKNIVESIIAGSEPEAFDNLDDDLSYAADLGIITRNPSEQVRFANKIYGEIIPRVMSYNLQRIISYDYGNQAWYIQKDGTLDMDKLLKKFQEFYRRNSESWLERYEYKEAGHQLLLMAFLQRVVNAGGGIEREMAVGNGRIDLYVTYKSQGFVLELKIYRGTYTREEGLEQTSRYMDKLGKNHGYLVIFNPDKTIPWEQRLSFEEVTHGDKKITIVGL